jgi:hypothetical protein
VVIFEGVLLLETVHFLFRDGQFYSARGGGNRSSLKKPSTCRKSLTNFIFSFILSHSNKGIKHCEDFDKKKFKREYLGRIIDNVDFFSE